MLQRQDTPKPKIKKGDTVMVISGKDRGKRGQVIDVNPSKGTITLGGINLVTRHQKQQPNAKNPAQAQQAGRIQKPAPMNVSKVMLIDPHSDKPTRVGRKIFEGKLVRYAKVSGEIIDAV
ncbi:MAG: 50S ribosomal protein L24 [bacterium]